MQTVNKNPKGQKSPEFVVPEGQPVGTPVTKNSRNTGKNPKGTMFIQDFTENPQPHNNG